MSVGNKFKPGDKVIFIPERENIKGVWRKVGSVDTTWIEQKQSINGFIKITKFCSVDNDIHLEGCSYDYHYPIELFELFNEEKNYECW